MAAAAVVHRKRPAPDDGEVCPAAEAGENKRAHFNHKTVKEADYGLNLHSTDDVYETVEEDYEFDSIDDYEMLEQFGSSCCGGVARARDRCTGEAVAVKRVRPSEGDDDGAASICAVVREAGCLTPCRGHPSVLQIKSVAADENTGDLFIVTEPPLVGASTLRSRLITRRPFTEAETRALMRQLLGAAEKMHGAGVTHRDINLDNILVGPDGALKICGFGCATTMTVTTKPMARQHVGEPEPPMGVMRYRSPEQLYGGIPRYGPEEDIWALGCVMAELLTGAPLFVAADTEEDLLEQTIDLRDDIVTMGVEAFDGMLELSVAGRELLAGLLDFDSWQRPTAADALRHRWFTEEQNVKADSCSAW
jgi:cell division cycle 2-like protein